MAMNEENNPDVRENLADPPATPEETKESRFGKRAAIGALAVICLLASLGGAAWVVGRSRTKVTVGQKDSGEPGANRPEDRQTDAVIAALGEQFDDNPAPGAASQAAPQDVQAVSAVTEATGLEPAPGVAATVAPAGAPAAHAQPGDPAGRAAEPREAAPRENPQKSHYYVDSDKGRARSGGGEMMTVAARRAAATTAPALPPFGTMLPIRTLGATYTIAEGGLVRAELTRDMSGPGWSLPRGTTIVAAVRGSGADRAFMTAIGYIDRSTNKLVRFKGDVLSADGGSGLKGKRRKVGSAWKRVLDGVRRTGVGVAEGAARVFVSGTVARSIPGGSRPVIIRDTLGALPMGYEFGGISRGDDSYVEVKANTVGFVLVTELPDAVQGVDAVADMPAEEIAEFADTSRPRGSTGLSEEELSQIISEGSPDTIRAALPRMTPEMRRVAEQVLAASGK